VWAAARDSDQAVARRLRQPRLRKVGGTSYGFTGQDNRSK